ncbi:MAG: hypothetical protein A2928_02950 [Candidatus Taylorbacteria bacterium RIFCSPLOWO2_01_FULL_45_15b]|uniref:Uncharacterized protein n=1 Tax=Candidatus Taylorbacteria bacterium RIFCSPLOWO2_01_FULL_45_15b TaxID=1802319 RepID=A0A1G2NDZ8_9BACT|nr:MAG: hypothetical protein A2928_02950 [Candidatus Taylorbacteria bacterium RIFCSPLOWO2_01_FULL_45_15b]
MEINKGHYKKLLEDELRTLESELKTVGRINPDNPKDWEPTPAKMDTDSADQNEVADTIEEFEENAAILKQLEIRFNEVKEGLVRIESGNYGVCKHCGKIIETGRLEANPAASTCMEHTK